MKTFSMESNIMHNAVRIFVTNRTTEGEANDNLYLNQTQLQPMTNSFACAKSKFCRCKEFYSN